MSLELSTSTSGRCDSVLVQVWRASETSAQLFKFFPNEILTQIFANLPFADLVSLQLTCRRFYAALAGTSWVWNKRLVHVLFEQETRNDKIPLQRFATCATCVKLLLRYDHFSDGDKDTCLQCQAMIMEATGRWATLRIYGEVCVYMMDGATWVPEKLARAIDEALEERNGKKLGMEKIRSLTKFRSFIPGFLSSMLSRRDTAG